MRIFGSVGPKNRSFMHTCEALKTTLWPMHCGLSNSNTIQELWTPKMYLFQNMTIVDSRSGSSGQQKDQFQIQKFPKPLLELQSNISKIQKHVPCLLFLICSMLQQQLQKEGTREDHICWSALELLKTLSKEMEWNNPSLQEIGNY